MHCYNIFKTTYTANGSTSWVIRDITSKKIELGSISFGDLSETIGSVNEVLIVV